MKMKEDYFHQRKIECKNNQLKEKFSSHHQLRKYLLRKDIPNFTSYELRNINTQFTSKLSNIIMDQPTYHKLQRSRICSHVVKQ